MVQRQLHSARFWLDFYRIELKGVDYSSRLVVAARCNCIVGIRRPSVVPTQLVLCCCSFGLRWARRPSTMTESRDIATSSATSTTDSTNQQFQQPLDKTVAVDSGTIHSNTYNSTNEHDGTVTVTLIAAARRINNDDNNNKITIDNIHRRADIEDNSSTTPGKQHRSGVTTSEDNTGNVILGSFYVSVTLLCEREAQMHQTARILGIPESRWNGSLLHRKWHEQNQNQQQRITTSIDDGVVASSKPTTIFLNPEKISETTPLAFYSWTQPGKRTSCERMTRMIHTYYTTGTLVVPPCARGYDVLAAMDFFGILYQPDQCQFGDYAVYQRVQQWSRYLCHRPALAACVLQTATAAWNRPFDSTLANRQTIAFGTDWDPEQNLNARQNNKGMKLNAQTLYLLGENIENELSTDAATTTHANMIKVAYKLFNPVNSSDLASNAFSNLHNLTTSNNDEEEATLPGPEEDTAADLRKDFCAYLTSMFSTTTPNNTCDYAVHFSMKAVTLYDTDEHDNPNRSDSVSRRAVLVLDLLKSKDSSTTTSAENNLIDTLVPYGRTSMEECVPKVEPKTVTFKESSFDSLFSAESSSRQSSAVDSPMQLVNESLKNENPLDSSRKTDLTNSALASWNHTCSLSLQPIIDYDAPHDELNACMESAVLPNSSTTCDLQPSKKKKKPKPVFELPDKLLAIESNAQTMPIVQSAIGQTNDFSMPGPITIVRTGTYDNTVTSALTGPFYIDDNGNLRDVFENSNADSENEGNDDDARAQAKRHEWIQTALLNRGIGERMESLLKQEDDEQNADVAASFDPWDWLTGLGVCEFSRTVMRSMEEYASGIGVDLHSNPDQNDATPDTQKAGRIEEPEVLAVLPVLHTLDNRDVRNPSTTVKDRLQMIQELAHDELSRDDTEELDETPISQVQPRQHSGSESSKESPRGVLRFDTIQTDSSKTSVQRGIDVEAAASGETELSLSGINADVEPKRRMRGIKTLFRRRKAEG